MKIDPVLASLFHVEWLEPLDETTRDDYERAIAEKADAILRSARFLDEQRLAGDHDVEVRVWVEGAVGSACVSVTWEPGREQYGFHLLDESLRERLACVVFDSLPCVRADDSLAQGAELLRALAEADPVRLRVREPDDE